MYVEASSPGKLVAIDMYGPLPKCAGGTMALLVITTETGYKLEEMW